MKKSPKDYGHDIAYHDVPEWMVASWCPEPNCDGVPATQVHIQLSVPGISKHPLIMRLKSKRAADDLIAALIEHRDYVWPTEPGEGDIVRITSYEDEELVGRLAQLQTYVEPGSDTPVWCADILERVDVHADLFADEFVVIERANGGRQTS